MVTRKWDTNRQTRPTPQGPPLADHGKPDNSSRVTIKQRRCEQHFPDRSNAESIATRTVKNGETLTADEIREIESGKAKIFAFGKITYADILDSQHWTSFYYSFNPATGEYEAYHQYNEADNDGLP